MGIFEDVLRAKREIECTGRPAQSLDLAYGGVPQPDPVATPFFGQFGDSRRMDQVFGIPIQVANYLPIVPDHKEDARRIVRHGIKKALPWLKIDPGLKPGEQVHAVVASDLYDPRSIMLFVSRDFDVALRRSA